MARLSGDSENLSAEKQQEYLGYARSNYRRLCKGAPTSLSPRYTHTQIFEYLKKAGAVLCDLDETGQSSEAVVEETIKKAFKEASLAQAQQDYTKLIDGIGSVDLLEIIVKGIEENLADAGKDYAALDSRGKKTSKEMKAELDRAIRQNYLEGARREFQKFQETTVAHSASSVDYLRGAIQKHVTLAGKALKDLDETGQLTDQDIEEHLDRASRRIHLMAARQGYNEFGDVGDYSCEPESIDRAVKDIYERLHLAGVGVGALDDQATSTTSDADMQAAFDQKIAQTHRTAARRMFQLLPEKTFYSRTELNLWQKGIATHFAAAASDARVLAREDAQTDEAAQEMARALQRACVAAEEKYAKENPDEGILPVKKIKFKPRPSAAGAGR